MWLCSYDEINDRKTNPLWFCFRNTDNRHQSYSSKDLGLIRKSVYRKYSKSYLLPCLKSSLCPSVLVMLKFAGIIVKTFWNGLTDCFDFLHECSLSLGLVMYEYGFFSFFIFKPIKIKRWPKHLSPVTFLPMPVCGVTVSQIEKLIWL